MSAKDIFHNTVHLALEKEGWLTKLEVRIQKSEVIFVTGIRARIQKYIADLGGVLDPVILIITE